ncbi:MAG: hypothetical protein H6744_07860 [Deltaproteobacteria bacterium]|nr:hypothetical protein [Deltaproteobacteria bacterium]
MRRSLHLASLLLLTLALALPAGCDDGGGGTTADVVADTASDTSGAVTYATVKPIYASKCSPCHTGSGFGGHNIGDNFASADKPASISKCAGLTKAECTIVRIKAGDMPQGRGCTGDPSLDVDNTACLTQAQQDLIQTWIDAGTPE